MAVQRQFRNIWEYATEQCLSDENNEGKDYWRGYGQAVVDLGVGTMKGQMDFEAMIEDCIIEETEDDKPESVKELDEPDKSEDLSIEDFFADFEDGEES